MELHVGLKLGVVATVVEQIAETAEQCAHGFSRWS
jgi:hypothetical protein